MNTFLPYDKFPVKDHEATFESRSAERQRQKFERIDFFIAKHGLIGRIHEGRGRKLALLDLPTLDEIDPGVVDKYLAQRLEAETTDIFNNCFEIARMSCASGAATGILEADDGTQELVGWANHRINYGSLEDSSVLATDLTARENIAEQGNEQFDVLALRAPNLEGLLSQVGELYGGDWHEVDRNDY